MKKVIALLILALFIVGCSKQESDGSKFKKEYEALNGQDTESGKAYTELTIASDNPMVYATYDQIKEMLTSGTGVIYFGFPQCPWCRQALPVFLEAASDANLTKVLYYNNKEQRDTKHLDENGKVITDTEGTQEYAELLTLLGDNASAYEGLNDSSIKRLYFPTFVFVNEGKIVGYHEATLSDVQDPYVALTTKQHDTLYKIFEELIVKTTTCDLGSKC